MSSAIKRHCEGKLSVLTKQSQDFILFHKIASLLTVARNDDFIRQ
ncbi:hypothetical protein [Rickettsia hoogstraalii]|nr:hypothetical protein [Rickettsia hoogstraalii]